MRRALSFPCNGDALAATLDDAPGVTGLLIISGGNEIRSGAHRGMAMLAHRVAAAGHPVLRFDRRGIGDSEGDNGGFETSRDDITAAIAAFRAACPALTRVIAFGNCDAASALVLHQPLPLDRLILANPWTYDDDGTDGGGEDGEPALPPASAIRARYIAKLRDPASLWRLIKGDINLGKLARGLLALGKGKAAPADTSLAARLRRGLDTLSMPAAILLATGDRTAMAFDEYWTSPAWAGLHGRFPIHRLASPSHSFAGDDADWLAMQILAVLKN